MTLVAHSSLRDGKAERDRLAEAEQMLVDRIDRGMRPSELMEKYQVSKATLYRRLEAAVDARIAPTVDRYREMQNAALDELVAKWNAQQGAAEVLIASGAAEENMTRVEKGVAMRAAALEAKLRILDRRAKLNGLDAPVKAEVRVTVEDDGVQGRIDAMVAEMSRRDAEALDG